MTTEFTEIYLSAVIGRSVINSKGDEIGLLRDLIMVPGDVFPEVSHIVIKARKGIFSLPWNEVTLFTHVVISASSVRPPGLSPFQSYQGEILVKRDLLDKQIVDVDGAKVVRVNDIKLGNLNQKLCIFSVDIGFRGLLRRLGYERFGERFAQAIRRDIPHNEISWEYVQPLEANSSRLALNIARDQMNELHPADLADIIENIPIQNIKMMLESMDAETAGETLYELEPDMRNVVISQLDDEQVSDILEEMEPDDAADVLSDLPEQKAQELLHLMDQEDAEDIQELLEHEEDSAGGLMTPEYFRLASNISVGRALELLKEGAEEAETVYYGYVVDAEERLEGVVSLKTLLLSSPDAHITDVMEENVKYVHVDSEPEDMLEMLTKYDLIALPVLDEEDRMAGIVTVDDVLAHYLPLILKNRRR
ncbi:magnesium transporter [Geobacter sp. SVR]|uniref:magnesium transporter n=1 Tax=Geobacter sp. SVR TaxID=2495594 RepID=UPI00143EF8BC|nr:CBS domain-containing protein [Geobacter sp. SVR]BCS54663.1 membrane protein [Geobacter sp. SVR]GCF87603.1 membrane protein [Geobacter sp. SVR]